MFKSIRRAAVAGLIILSACAAHAIQILPDNGLWGFDAEATGQPGRGFQIDKQQGRLTLFTYMGYRADGTPTFLQAGGEQSNSTFEGELVEFRGGTVLGGAYSSAQAVGSAGRMKIVFDSPTTGTLTLPGESPQRVSRIIYENNSERFYGLFIGLATRPNESNAGFQNMSLRLRNGLFDMEFSKSGFFSECMFSGTYQLAGSGIVTKGTFSCAPTNQSGTYRTEDFIVEAQGLLRGRLYLTYSGSSVEEGAISLAAHCVAGPAIIIYPRCAFVR